jgi:4-amino-4-deoxy-L-arabinose transferase-like glycosyltransferase
MADAMTDDSEGATRVRVGGRFARADLGLGALLLAYLAVRLALIPADVSVTSAQSHDGSYICIVAGRLVQGLGYTNPAHWLVFLNPPSLPMPYHNANPGYPTLVAATMAALGTDAPRAGVIVSLLSSGAIAALLYGLVRSFGRGPGTAAVAAAAGLLLPESWTLSFRIAPDLLMTALSLAVIYVAYARPAGALNALAAGVLFGLAWLVRSTAMLLLPPLAYALLLRDGVRRTAISVALVLAAAAVTISPWLAHNQATWGKPFRSDAGYYWLQDYHAREFGGDIGRYWRSTTTPPGLGEVVRADPSGFAEHLARGVPVLVYRFLAGLSGWSKPLLAALLGGLGGALWLGRRHLLSREGQAMTLLLVGTLASLLPRAGSLEARYVLVSVVLLAAWMATMAADGAIAWREGRSTRRDRVAVALLAIAGLACVATDAANLPEELRVRPGREAARARARAVAEATGRAPIVVHDPYFYTLDTGGVSALEPPYTDKAGLLSYMERYGARHLLLPEDPQAVPFLGSPPPFGPELAVRRRYGDYQLLERIDP